MSELGVGVVLIGESLCAPGAGDEIADGDGDRDAARRDEGVRAEALLLLDQAAASASPVNTDVGVLKNVVRRCRMLACGDMYGRRGKSRRRVR